MSSSNTQNVNLSVPTEKKKKSQASPQKNPTVAKKDFLPGFNFTINASEAIALTASFNQSFGGPGAPRRDQQTLTKEAQDYFMMNLGKVTWGMHSNSLFIAPEEAITSEGLVTSISNQDWQKEVIEIMNRNLGISLIGYLASRGPFNKNRFWLQMGNTLVERVKGGDKFYLYIGWPTLAEEGHHGQLLMAFHSSISSYLDQGGFSAILSFMTASGNTVPSSLRKFAFKKGMHVAGFPRGRHGDLIKDLNNVFEVMKVSKGKGIINGLAFLTSSPTVVTEDKEEEEISDEDAEGEELDEEVRRFENQEDLSRAEQDEAIAKLLEAGTISIGPDGQYVMSGTGLTVSSERQEAIVEEETVEVDLANTGLPVIEEDVEVSISPVMSSPQITLSKSAQKKSKKKGKQSPLIIATQQSISGENATSSEVPISFVPETPKSTKSIRNIFKSK
jgi:hypothetical protein